MKARDEGGRMTIFKDEGGRIKGTLEAEQKDENSQKQTTGQVAFILLLRFKCALDPSSFILILVTALVVGCATPPRHEAPATKAPPTAPVTKGGGYYLDDGPGPNPPANIDAIPDAVPRVEPLHKGALRPYTVMGRHYTPMTVLAPYRARGVASWYGRRYHGKQTSSGEIYDMYAMTAAHTTLPIPSYARVTNVATGKSVVVRVNDRGPFIDSRLIDLSYTAAHRLGVLAGGSAVVEVETIMPGAAPSPVIAVAPTAPSAPPASSVAAPPPVPPPPAAPERQIVVTNDSGGAYLQLAAFGTRDNAEAYATRLRAEQPWLAAQLQVYIRDGLFRVHAGPYANQGDARAAADRISQAMGIKPLVFVK
jgi:rare lipoprotein A